jgi:iron(III) transport system substrate-binding protein
MRLEIAVGNKRRLCVVAIVALAGLGLVACGSDADAKLAPCTIPTDNPAQAALIKAAQKEGEFDWASGLEDDESAKVVGALKKQFPCIKVTQTRINDDDSREKILREIKAGNAPYDVLDVSGTDLPDYKAANAIEEFDWKSVFPTVDDRQLTSFGTISIGGSLKAIAWNTDLVSEPPTGWEDMLDPKYNGEFVVDSKPKFLTNLIPAWGEDKTLAYAKALGENGPQFRRGQEESIQLLAAGDFPILVGTYAASVQRFMDSAPDAPIKYEFVDPVPFSFENQAITSTAKHPNAAKVIIGWLATDGNKFYASATHRGLPMPELDTEESAEVEGHDISYFTGDEFITKEDDIQDAMITALGAD